MNVYEEVRAFYESYRGEKRVIGRSAEGREIFALHIGLSRGKQGIAQYAIHGREWITGVIALYHVRRGLSRGGAWVIPLSNPDGALISEVGLSSLSEERRKRVMRINGGADLRLWKANANAVDLNVNFGARWGTGAHNVTRPAPENYIGEEPFSEPETRTLRDFTAEISPAYTVSFHTKGGEIYWRFHQPLFRMLRDRRHAVRLSRATGYPLASAGRSAGGYKDWCVAEFKIPAFTVEIGRDELAHPIGRESLSALLPETLGSLDALASSVCGRKG